MRLSEPSHARKWQAECLQLRDDTFDEPQAVAKMLKAAGWYAAKTTVAYIELHGQASP